MDKKIIKQLIDELYEKGDVEFVFMTKDQIVYNVTDNKVLNDVVKFVNERIDKEDEA